MQIRYRISFDDYVEAQRTHRKVSKGERWAIWIMLGTVLLLVGLAVFVSIMKRTAFTHMWWFPLGYGILVGVFLYGRPFWARKFRGIRNLQREFQMEISDDKLAVSSDVAHGEMKWEGFTKWTETKNLFLLYSQPSLFNIVPKRSFTSGGIEEFRDILSRKVVSKL